MQWLLLVCTYIFTYIKAKLTADVWCELRYPHISLFFSQLSQVAMFFLFLSDVY